jgi:hypothetical protein
MSMAPGTIPATVNPPRAPEADEAAVAAAPSTRVAAVAPPEKSGLLASLRKMAGGATADTTAATPKATEVRAAEPKVADSKTAAPRPLVAAPKAVAAKPTETRQAAAHAPYKPQTAEAPAPAASSQTSLVAGASPIVQSSSFDNRFSAMK